MQQKHKIRLEIRTAKIDWNLKEITELSPQIIRKLEKGQLVDYEDHTTNLAQMKVPAFWVSQGQNELKRGVSVEIVYKYNSSVVGFVFKIPWGLSSYIQLMILDKNLKISL